MGYAYANRFKMGLQDNNPIPHGSYLVQTVRTDLADASLLLPCHR
jgi:hypothetical protein